MLKPQLIPTPLFADVPRQPLPVIDPAPPRITRWLRIAIFLMGVLAYVARAGLATVWGRRLDSARGAIWIRESIEKLGGLWLKAGQLLAMRRDFFSQALCDELSKLHDVAPGFPFPCVRDIVREELHCEMADVFAAFEERPIAAASIGQVHRAILPSGLDVAVKVQRPYIRDVYRRDLRAIGVLVRLLEFVGFRPHARWSEMLWQLRRTMSMELDYRYEASSLERMKKLLRWHRVYAPRVFPELSTERILVMEYIHGVFLSDYIRASIEDPERLTEWRTENNVDARKVGRRLYTTHTRQVFEDNLFHCDLHPGNIVLLRNSRLALIDFGSVASIEASQLSKYHMIFRATAARDYVKVADVFLLLTTTVPNIEMETVRREVVKTMQAWESAARIPTLPFHEKSLTNAMLEILSVFRDYHIPIVWELLQVNRAELTMDASLAFLAPEVNYFKLIERYQRGARRRRYAEWLGREAVQRRVEGLASAADLPPTLTETAQLESEWVRVRGVRREEQPGSGPYFAQAFLGVTAAAALLLFVASIAAGSQFFVASYVGVSSLKLIVSLYPGAAAFGKWEWAAGAFAALYIYRISSRESRRLRGRRR